LKTAKTNLSRIGWILIALFCAALLSAHGQQGKRVRPKAIGDLFHTSNRCMACHNGLTTPTGKDVSIGFDWRPSIMANSSRDPYWQAGVRRETIDHPESQAAIEDECSICHMPMARFHAKTSGRTGQIFSHFPFDPEKEEDRFAADGVSCSLCHQITPDKLGTSESFVGGFVVDAEKPPGQRPEYGPFPIDAGHARIMRSSTGGFQPTQSAHLRQSEVCATCHTLYTKALGPQGTVAGELPEQVPYQEWQHSGYREARSCQSCHMPEIADPMPVSTVFGEPRPGVARHIFVGGNFFMQKLLNRFRKELQVEALPQEMAAAAERTIDHLKQEAAELTISGIELRENRLVVSISVKNLAGHKLPTAYPSRRAWLHVMIRDRNGQVIFESGALDPTGLIRGNDNDADPNRFEPHYREISAPDQVQIYECVMADASGTPTTGLLKAVRFVKDNRLLPAGFDKKTAGNDIAVRGEAADDPDFLESGDSIRYSIPVTGAPGPYQIEAELWYQSIGYRWAQNLRPYDAFEPKRFLEFYETMAKDSGVVLARVKKDKITG
jgi:hypothetical protein